MRSCMTEIGIIRALPVETLGDNRTGMLRHFDEVRARDLLDALGIHHRAGQQATTRALARLIEDGQVERIGTHKPLYRITEAGRAFLASMLARGNVTEAGSGGERVSIPLTTAASAVVGGGIRSRD